MEWAPQTNGQKSMGGVVFCRTYRVSYPPLVTAREPTLGFPEKVPFPQKVDAQFLQFLGTLPWVVQIAKMESL